MVPVSALPPNHEFGHVKHLQFAQSIEEVRNVFARLIFAHRFYNAIQKVDRSRILGI